ncbi:electron transfer flavoprotein subunit beta/FixA family protein [Extibacter muris]|uniref:electron transfer flavoprotein subunit beta/FixA family protein n=1 Tax=Extibacter muris TaxID=1796622 RepID=UPI001D0955DC|nr:electron transfer flavoprotein subunit beta/FixA family protein [Extibacter muris]MCB6201910.1 electron transfer flavoprotein subunit beta/FixA family protein [Extibacter muris]MCQ4663247.1 electron transfer flavoprotein subunit beta/FixA family protein [Extibacter muris]MCQ4692475.1 electron transfer flavoprotein subunit beta/FixA family protein [Extibacter muris]
MEIAVFVKQVPDTNEVRINQETGTLIRDGVPSIINPDDKNALEAALRLKETCGGTVTVISMGPPQAAVALKEALAMGADKACLVSDRAFGGSDTWATATILAAAAKKTGPYDVILCGRQAIDGDTAQVGPELAEFLDIAQVTYVKEIRPSEDGLEVIRYTETGNYRFTAVPPVLFTAVKELNTPRYPDVKNILRCFDGEEVIRILTLQDLSVDITQIGIKGSPTNVYRSFVPVKEKKTQMLTGTDGKAVAAQLADRLHALKLL